MIPNILAQCAGAAAAAYSADLEVIQQVQYRLQMGTNGQFLLSKESIILCAIDRGITASKRLFTGT